MTQKRGKWILLTKDGRQCRRVTSPRAAHEADDSRENPLRAIPGGGKRRPLDDFTWSYITTALSTSLDKHDRPLESTHDIDGIAPATLHRMKSDAADFQRRFGHLLGDWSRVKAGHDFWLTRNRHGAGFWDGDWIDGEALTKAAHSFGEFNLYVGDDGMIYAMGHERPRYLRRVKEEARETIAKTPPAREARDQEEPAGEAAAVPWVKLERDPEKYREAMARAKEIGKVADARAIFDLLSPALAKEDQEVFLVTAIDARGQIRDVVEVHRGGQSRVAVEIPVIMRAANALGGEMFVVIHNHPTGHAKPSKADRELTKAIESAAQTNELVFMDHVIVGLDEYFSFAENKVTPVKRA